MAKRKSSTKRLAKAQESLTPVRLIRSIKKASRLDGYVLEVGRRWLVLAVIGPDLALDGYACLRVADLADVRTLAHGGLTTRLLKARGQWPPPAPDLELDLDSGRAPLAGFVEQRRLVGLHYERDEPGAYFLGVPAFSRKGHLQLHELTPRAEWGGKPLRFGRAAITRLHFGDRYQRALAEIAGPRPGTGPAEDAGPVAAGPVQRAIRDAVQPGELLATASGRSEFSVAEYTAEACVLAVGPKRVRRPVPWPALEGAAAWLAGRDWTPVGSSFGGEPVPGTLDAHLRSTVRRSVAGWVAVLLVRAGLAEAEQRPLRVRVR